MDEKYIDLMIDTDTIVYALIIIIAIYLIYSTSGYGIESYDTVSIASCKNYNSNMVSRLTTNKYKMNRYLKEHSIPVPNAMFVGLEKFRIIWQTDPENVKSEIGRRIRNLDRPLVFPVIMKPISGQCGEGIVSGIQGLNELSEHVTKYISNLNSTSSLIIEEQLVGRVYRLMYVNKKLIGVIVRDIPIVTGNGKSTIEQLLYLYNSSTQYIDKVELNESFIAAQGYNRYSVLKPGESVKVTNILNFEGERQRNVPLDSVHPVNKKLFDQLVSKDLNINCAGIDFISPDIRIPYYENNAAVLEINSNPDRKIHYLTDKKFKSKYYRQLRDLKRKAYS